MADQISHELFAPDGTETFGDVWTPQGLVRQPIRCGGTHWENIETQEDVTLFLESWESEGQRYLEHQTVATSHGERDLAMPIHWMFKDLKEVRAYHKQSHMLRGLVMARDRDYLKEIVSTITQSREYLYNISPTDNFKGWLITDGHASIRLLHYEYAVGNLFQRSTAHRVQAMVAEGLYTRAERKQMMIMVRP